MEKNIIKEGLYVYNWVTLLYNRDWHNIVNQLYFNKKKKEKISKKEKHFRFWKSEWQREGRILEEVLLEDCRLQGSHQAGFASDEEATISSLSKT